MFQCGKSEDGAGLGTIIVVASFVLLEVMNANVFEDTHDRFEEIGDGLGVLGAAFFVDHFPFCGDFVSNILVKKFVGCISIGPIDFVTMLVLVFAIMATIVTLVVMTTAESIISFVTVFFVLVFFLATSEVVMMTMAAEAAAAAKVAEAMLIVMISMMSETIDVSVTPTEAVMTAAVVMVFTVSLPKITALFRIPAALHATLKDVVVDLVSFITNHNDRHLAKIAALVDLRKHARNVLEGVGAE